MAGNLGPAEYNPFETPATAATPATATPGALGPAEYNPFAGDTAFPREAPKGGAIDDLIRKSGQNIGALGSVMQDVPGLKGAGQAVESAGNNIVDAHPSEINNLGDIIHKPGTFAREALTEGGADAAGVLATGEAGRLAGGLIGAAADGVGAIPGQAIGGRVGAGAYVFGQEYGGIRQAQRQKGRDSLADKAIAVGGASAATALEFLFGPEKYAAMIAGKNALKDVAKKAGGSFVKDMLKEGVGEGVTEVAQSAVERLSQGDSLTDQDAIDDYVVSGAKGAVGGGVLGPVMHRMAGGHGTQLDAERPTGEAHDVLSGRPLPEVPDTEQAQRQPDLFTGEVPPETEAAPATAPAAETGPLNLDTDFTKDAIAARMLQAGGATAGTMDGETGQSMEMTPQVKSLSTSVANALDKTDPEAAGKLVDAARKRNEKAFNDLAGEQGQLDDARGEHTDEEHGKYQAQIDAKLDKILRHASAIKSAADTIAKWQEAVNAPPNPQPDLFSATRPQVMTTPAQAPGIVPGPAQAVAPAAAPMPAPTIMTQQTPEQGAAVARAIVPELAHTGQVAADTRLAEQMRAGQHEDHLAAASSVSANAKMRTAILDDILGDPRTRDAQKRFEALLKRYGMVDETGKPVITPEEKARLDHYNEVRETLHDPNQPDIYREPSSPDESGGFGIKEKTNGVDQTAPQAAAQTAERAEPAAGATAEAAAPAEAPVEGNIRTRAETHAETLGSSQRAWFLKGVDAEFGDTDTPRPPAQRGKWYDEGRAFVATERAHQEREAQAKAEPPKKVVVEKKAKTTRSEQIKATVAEKKAAPKSTRSEEIKAKVAEQKAAPPANEETKPAAPPKAVAPKEAFPQGSRGGRGTFRREVDEAVGQTISAQQAQQLFIAEEHAEEMGGKMTRTVATNDLWRMFDDAQAEYAKQHGLKGGAAFGSATGWDSAEGGARNADDHDVDRRIAQATTAMRAALNRMGLRDVGLKVSTAVGIYMKTGRRLGGYYAPIAHLIGVAIDSGRPMKTLWHEAGHAMRQLDLFTPQEWKAMVLYAKRNGLVGKAAAHEEYAGGAQGAFEEEGAVEGYAQWKYAKDSTLPEPQGLVRRAFTKISNLLEAISNAFHGAGFQTSEDVFKRIESGEIGNRERGVVRQGERDYGAAGGKPMRNITHGDAFQAADERYGDNPRDRLMAARRQLTYNPENADALAVANRAAKELGLPQIERGPVSQERRAEKPAIVTPPEVEAAAPIGDNFRNSPDERVLMLKRELSYMHANDEVGTPKWEATQREFEAAQRAAVEERNGTLKENLTRRQLLGAAVAAGPVLAHAQTLTRTSVAQNATVQHAFHNGIGNLADVVKAIRDTTKNPVYREIARLMTIGGFKEGATINISDEGNAELALAGQTDPVTGNVTVYKTTNGISGDTEETILHEALHSFLGARYSSLSVYNGHNRELVKDAPGARHADQAINDFKTMWSEWSSNIAAKYPQMAGVSSADEVFRDTTDGKQANPNDGPAAIWLSEAHDSPDELFVRVMADPRLQQFLREHDIEGNKITPRDPNSMWERVLNFFAKLFGVKRVQTSSLDKIMDAANSVLKTAALDAPTGEFAAKTEAFQNKQNEVFGSATQNERVDRAIDQLPKEARPAANAFRHTADELLKKGHVWMAFTEDLANMAKQVLPSATKLIELHSRNFGLSREFEARLTEIKAAYERLPARLTGTGKGSVSEFLYDSRMAGKWGFAPAYSPKAVVDPALEKRFNAMPKPAQDVIRAVLRFNHDARNQLHRATVSAVNAAFDPLFDAATTDAERADLEKSKTKALADASRIFDTQEGLPYTPLKREGNWVVSAKSQAYKDAIANKDEEAMTKMRSDPEHNFVDFRDTRAEAEALAERLKTKFPGDIRPFERSDISDADIYGGELHTAFQKLTKLVEQQREEAPNSAAVKELHRLVTDLYVHSLADGSARKGELKADLVPAKDPNGEVLNAMHAFVSRGQAMTHYIAAVTNNREMQAAIKDMRTELASTEGAARQKAARFYNEIMYRYTKNLQARPNRLVEKVVRGTSIWTLLGSPFYYAQNMTQAALVSGPLLEAKYGMAAVPALTQGHIDFINMTKGDAPDARVDLRKAPADVRAVLQRLAERGRLDAGFKDELSKWEMNGDGVFPKAWNRVDRFLRRVPAKVEMMNRVASGIAAYRLAKAGGMSEEDAFQYASKIIYDSHGDYSGFNAPRPFHALGSFGKVMLQFRKFQLIMASLVAREFHRSFQGATPEEKWLGRRSLMLLGAHMGAVGGIVGLPGAALFGGMINAVIHALSGDDKDWDNWQDNLRSWLGAAKDGEDRSFLKDLLYKGLPYSLGVDVSGRIGLGNMLSISPYTDLGTSLQDRNHFMQNAGTLLLGAFGGLLAKDVDAWGYLRDGDVHKMLESILPGMAGTALKATRLTSEGLTSKNGDVLASGDEVSNMDALWVALGVTPRGLANITDRRSWAYEAEQHYSEMTTSLERQYTAAARAGDTDKMADLRQKWMEMNDARRQDGFRPSPLSTLARAPAQQRRREAQVIGGVPTTKSNRGLAQELAD